MDEAFMDVCPPEASLAGEVDRGNIVVLRSFGKFFGLAGLRLGFALAAPRLAAALNASLGPWAVSGPALAIGERALADGAWMDATRDRLADAAHRLDRLLAEANVEVVGGTSLFRLAQVNTAAETFKRLGQAGIVVRAFRDQPSWLRFGLPDDQDWSCLQSRLGTVRSNRP
jgi:cobalamin biosynthetic protein CobC